MFQVRVLYQFSGEPGTAEMSIEVDDILVVTRTDVGEGWWEGTNSSGKIGLFPEAYVEKVNNSGPPAMPPPLLTETKTTPWDSAPSNQPQPPDNDGWDDDWDDDVYTNINETPPTSQPLYSNEPNHNLQFGNEDTFSESNFGTDNKGTVTKKSLNRFSIFVKSNGENYILGISKSNPGIPKIKISKIEENLYAWQSLQNPYTVLVTSPKKETKLKGLKSFIAYQLTPSFNNIQVSRRYKHFDWLHERLTEKYCLLGVPPLPDKQISGRYEEQFIEHRRAQLQEFVDYVCRHPVFATCDVWHHFITCTDEKAWKSGKRQAEKDAFIGADFCLTIDAPEKSLLPSWVDEYFDLNTNFIHNLDTAIKNLLVTSADQTKKHQSAFKREYHKIGESFYSFGTAIESAEKSTPSDLATAIKRVGTAYFDIGKFFEEQPKMDWQPLTNKLYLYKGITGSFPDILAIQKGAQQKKRDCSKVNMSPAQINEVVKRTETLTYVLLAETNHFKNEREVDIKFAMKGFLKEQINFYKKIVHKLEDTLQFFDE